MVYESAAAGRCLPIVESFSWCLELLEASRVDVCLVGCADMYPFSRDGVALSPCRRINLATSPRIELLGASVGGRPKESAGMPRAPSRLGSGAS